jgi:hypothetical protein
MSSVQKLQRPIALEDPEERRIFSGTQGETSNAELAERRVEEALSQLEQGQLEQGQNLNEIIGQCVGFIKDLPVNTLSFETYRRVFEQMQRFLAGADACDDTHSHKHYTSSFGRWQRW